MTDISCLQGGGGDGTTPSLLDARAASPSAVFAARFVATPFRGALAALPMDAALAAPLVDSSPFQLSECGVDTVCLADEAQRVAANLAMAAGGFAASPGGSLADVKAFDRFFTRPVQVCQTPGKQAVVPPSAYSALSMPCCAMPLC